MHDVNGTPLKVGDIVTIEARITDLYDTEDFCNVALDTIIGRRPDGKPERISAINTGVLTLKASCSVASRIVSVPGVPAEEFFTGTQVARVVAGLDVGKADDDVIEPEQLP